MHANARARPCLGASGGRTGGAQSREEEEEKSPVKGVSNYFFILHNYCKTRDSWGCKSSGHLRYWANIGKGSK